MLFIIAEDVNWCHFTSSAKGAVKVGVSEKCVKQMAKFFYKLLQVNHTSVYQKSGTKLSNYGHKFNQWQIDR